MKLGLWLGEERAGQGRRCVGRMRGIGLVVVVGQVGVVAGCGFAGLRIVVVLVDGRRANSRMMDVVAGRDRMGSIRLLPLTMVAWLDALLLAGDCVLVDGIVVFVAAAGHMVSSRLPWLVVGTRETGSGRHKHRRLVH
jgi:hypothetical protein